jgi:hypothetical protein
MAMVIALATVRTPLNRSRCRRRTSVADERLALYDFLALDCAIALPVWLTAMGITAKFIRLDHRDRELALAAARELTVTWIGLRTAGFTAVERRASRSASPAPRPHAWCGPPPRSSVAPPPIDRISWAVRAASRFIPGASNCLVRALATQTLLGRFGYRSELRIGARKDPAGSLAAHAWLESAGAIVIGEFALGDYVPLVPRSASQPDSPA